LRVSIFTVEVFLEQPAPGQPIPDEGIDSVPPSIVSDRAKVGTVAPLLQQEKPDAQRRGLP